MFFEPAIVKNHYPEGESFGKCPYAIVVYLLHVTEPVPGKIFLDIFEKCDLLRKEGKIGRAHV